MELHDEYIKLLNYLRYTLHELPVGVLYGPDGATEEQCKELMAETYKLEKISGTLGKDNSSFLQVCRWHYERYPHYIGRRKHFGNYEEYIKKYSGPLSGR